MDLCDDLILMICDQTDIISVCNFSLTNYYYHTRILCLVPDANIPQQVYRKTGKRLELDKKSRISFACLTNIAINDFGLYMSIKNSSWSVNVLYREDYYAFLTRFPKDIYRFTVQDIKLVNYKTLDINFIIVITTKCGLLNFISGLNSKKREFLCPRIEYNGKILDDSWEDVYKSEMYTHF